MTHDLKYNAYSYRLIHFSPPIDTTCALTWIIQMALWLGAFRKVGYWCCAFVSLMLKITATQALTHVHVNLTVKMPQTTYYWLERGVCWSSGSCLINLCWSSLLRTTHSAKIRPCDKWLRCQTFVTGCPDICKKCAATSTWWIGAFIPQPTPLKMKASRMFMEFQPPCCFSREALNFQWGGCRKLKRVHKTNPSTPSPPPPKKNSYRAIWSTKSQISFSSLL